MHFYCVGRRLEESRLKYWVAVLTWLTLAEFFPPVGLCLPPSRRVHACVLQAAAQKFNNNIASIQQFFLFDENEGRVSLRKCRMRYNVFAVKEP